MCITLERCGIKDTYMKFTKKMAIYYSSQMLRVLFPSFSHQTRLFGMKTAQSYMYHYGM